ncbi:MMPL family transporter [Nakamurella endophytica]|uniref:Membrane protein n=1 Tax=Nakamurella endophytica TaxID=1748367 RepID=A0A917SUW9_9ACTN|nr:MMPL family transporter [Nakamurella endophytica]GGL98933.1 membrane protein [Nakamurella endophytica]
MNQFLDALGRFSARHRWSVLLVWVAILGALLGVRAVAGGTFANDYSVPGSPSADGLAVLQQDFPQQGGYAGQIVFHAPTGAVSAQTAAVNTAMADVAKLPHVIASSSPFATPGSPQVARDGTTAYGTVSWDVVPAGLDEQYLADLDAAVQPARAAGLEVEYGAGAGQIGQAAHDLTSEVIGLSCALLLLLFMFGSIVAAVVPLLSALFSVLAGLSLVTILASAVTFPTTAPTVATLLGLGVAVDYGLFLIARHRENLDHGMGVVESVGRSTATSGAAVVVAGGTVVVAILGLYVSGVPFVGSLGLASAIVVAVAVLAAITLMPAFMGVCGQNVRAFKDLRAARRARSAGEVPDAVSAAALIAAADAAHEQSPFARWGRKVSNRPTPWAIGATLVLLVLCLPVLWLRLGQLDAGTNPTTDSSRRAYDLVADHFGPGLNGPLSVVAQVPAGTSPQDAQILLTGLQQTLGSTPGVAGVGAPAINTDQTVAVLTVVPTTGPQDEATTDLVDHLRDSVLPTVPAPTYVVGATAGYVDFTAKVAQRMPWLIFGVVALSFLLLLVAFRSLLIPVKAAILNLLSVGAAYGVVVAVFQWGWGSGLIGIHEQLPIPAFVPMLMFAIVFGLSMDYEVFLLSRVHEGWVRTGDAHRSVAIGIGGTAKVITTAAAIMVAVFTSFVLSTDPTVKMLAVGMAAAVLIDASIVRMVLVPAAMSLLDRRAWWLPRWIDRWTPNLDIEGTAHLARLEAQAEHAAGDSASSSPTGDAPAAATTAARADDPVPATAGTTARSIAPREDH